MFAAQVPHDVLPCTELNRPRPQQKAHLPLASAYPLLHDVADQLMLPVDVQPLPGLEPVEMNVTMFI